MEWRTRPGTMLLELVHAGQVLARIDGPHPAGFMLTVFTPERVTSLHRTLADAQRVGEGLQVSGGFSYRQRTPRRA